MEDFVPYELAIKLRDEGFNYNCLFAYNDEQIINPDVVEKYGALSDYSYYELTKDGGGELDWDYVYVYKTKLMLKRNIIVKRNFIDAPTISQVLKWLREEKKIHILIDVRMDLSWFYEIWGIEISLHPLGCVPYQKHQSYELAALAGIEYVIDNLI